MLFSVSLSIAVALAVVGIAVYFDGFLCVSCLYRECSYCARKSHTHCYGLMSFYVWKAFAVTTKRMPAKLSKNTQSKRARRTMRVKTSSRFDLRPVERMQHFSTHSHFVTIFKLIE